MGGGPGGADLEVNFQIALEVSLFNAADNAVAFPSGLYYVVYEFRDGDGSVGSVLGKQGPTLPVVPGSDVVGICVDVFLGVSDLHVILLGGSDLRGGGYDLARALDDCFGGGAPFGFRGLSGLKFRVYGAEFLGGLFQFFEAGGFGVNGDKRGASFLEVGGFHVLIFVHGFKPPCKVELLR